MAVERFGASLADPRRGRPPWLRSAAARALLRVGRPAPRSAPVGTRSGVFDRSCCAGRGGRGPVSAADSSCPLPSGGPRGLAGGWLPLFGWLATPWGTVATLCHCGVFSSLVPRPARQADVASRARMLLPSWTERRSRDRRDRRGEASWPSSRATRACLVRDRRPRGRAPLSCLPFSQGQARRPPAGHRRRPLHVSPLPPPRRATRSCINVRSSRWPQPLRTST